MSPGRRSLLPPVPLWASFFLPQLERTAVVMATKRSLTSSGFIHAFCFSSSSDFHVWLCELSGSVRQMSQGCLSLLPQSSESRRNWIHLSRWARQIKWHSEAVHFELRTRTGCAVLLMKPACTRFNLKVRQQFPENPESTRCKQYSVVTMILVISSI